MGMPIENCKKRLVVEKELAIKTGLNHDANGTLADAIDVAIDTMRKYQKIKTIIEMWKEDRKRFTLGDNGNKDEYLRQISEVIEDGIR